MIEVKDSSRYSHYDPLYIIFTASYQPYYQTYLNIENIVKPFGTIRPISLSLKIQLFTVIGYLTYGTS
jgi:hypothetical protein